MCHLTICIYSVEKYLSIFKSDSVFAIELYEFFIFRILATFQINNLKLFSRLHINFVTGFLCCAEAFQFQMESHLFFPFLLLLPLFLVSNPENHFKSFQSMFSFMRLMALGLTLESSIHLKFCVWCKIMVPFHSFAYSFSVFPALFHKEILLSLPYILGSSIVNQLTMQCIGEALWLRHVLLTFKFSSFII